MRKVNFIAAALVLAGLVAAACAPAGAPAPAPSPGAIKAPARVTIAYQPGLGYAQLIIMKRQQVLEKRFPNTTFEWKILAAGAPIRDGMIAGQIQVGAGGTGPFLVGWDRGVGWRILSSLNQMDLWLMAMDPNIKSLRDIKPGMQIGLPAPDSIQAVVLRRAAQQQLGNPNALDQNMVAIAHPAGVQALLGGQLAAHLTSPPFQFQEKDAGARVVLRSFDVFGPHTFNSVWVMESFYNEYPEFNKAFYEAIVEATRLIKEMPAEAARLVAEEEGGQVSPQTYRDWMTREGMVYDTVPRGFLKFAEFMRSIGMISKAPSSIKELTVPLLGDAGD